MIVRLLDWAADDRGLVLVLEGLTTRRDEPADARDNLWVTCDRAI